MGIRCNSSERFLLPLCCCREWAESRMCMSELILSTRDFDATVDAPPLQFVLRTVRFKASVTASAVVHLVRVDLVSATCWR